MDADENMLLILLALFPNISIANTVANTKMICSEY